MTQVVELLPSTEIVAALTERLTFATESESLHVIQPYLAVMPL